MDKPAYSRLTSGLNRGKLCRRLTGTEKGATLPPLVGPTAAQPAPGAPHHAA